MNDKQAVSGLLEKAASMGIRYRQRSASRTVAPTDEALAAVERLIEPMPESGTPDTEVLALLDQVGSSAAMTMTGPRFFGFVIGGSLPVTVASNWLSTVWDQNTVMHEVTTATATFERVAMDWMIDIFGLPTGSAAAFVTGATVANFTALAAARNRVYTDIGWDVEADGLIGAPPLTIIVGEEAHPTVFKSLGMLGFGRDTAIRVPVDGQDRMDASRLPRIAGPTIVCTQAGNINTGAFDPVGDICAAVKPHGAWVHVDGAFGLWAAASSSLRPLCSGLESADSWATDAHKWLNVPYDSGVAFVSDAAALKSAMSITADYLLMKSEFRNPSDFTPELSRRARGVDIWAALKSLGREGVAEIVDRCCRNAKRFAHRLRAEGYTVINDVVLNQVLVSFGEASVTTKIVAEVQKEGTCWCGSTVWQGQTAMRISVCNASTTAADVDQSLDAIIAIADRYR